MDGLNIYTIWGDGGRDGIAIDQVLCKLDGSDEWVDVAGAVSYGVADNNTFGALYASLSCDGTELKTCNVAFGEAAEPPSDPERAGDKFIGWDGDYTYILKDVTLTAQYQVCGLSSGLLFFWRMEEL